MNRFAFFDFDDTLSRGDSVVPYLLYAIRGKKAPWHQVLRAAAGFLVQLGRSGKISRAKELTFSFIRGKSTEEMDDLGRAFFREIITPRLFEEGIARLWSLKSAGYTIVVVSASADVYMHLLPELLPVDAVLSTSCLQENGVYTGKIGPNCKGEEKVRRIYAWLEENGLTLDAENACAFGDSLSDLPMLKLTGAPTLVNPGRKLASALPDAAAVQWR